MNYLKSFTNRAHSYSNAVELYNNVLDEEIITAINNLELKKDDILLNIFAGGIPIDKYINEELNITYLAFDIHTDFIVNSISKCTFDKIPVESNSVNKIICLATLHHLNNDERAILYSELYRILIPGGRLVIADVIYESSQAKWLNEFVNKYNSNGHDGIFFTENDSKLMEKIGFKVDVCVNKYNWNFKDKGCLLHFCKLLFGLNLCIDDNLLFNSIKKYLHYDNGKIPWELIYFNCVKFI
jgi:SAM-dependent methyltransferase